MSKVLFVKANNRPSDQAVSVRLYEAFLQNYRESHQDDEIIELDLYQENLPYLDNVMLTGIYKSGQGFELTAEEQALVDIADKYINQFLDADKVVFGFPLWNQTVPAVLHTYIDYLNRAGKTFRFTPAGAIGLVPDTKVALLNARGGDYSGENNSAEMAVNFVLENLKLFGVKNITTVIIEGHNQYPDRRTELIENGIQQAIQAAVKF